MMNQTLEKRMLLLIAQNYALTFDELSEVYTQIQSIDKLMAIVEQYKHNGSTLLASYESWKSTV